MILSFLSKIGSHCVTLAILELYIHQASLELIRNLLPLGLSPGIKAVNDHTLQWLISH